MSTGNLFGGIKGLVPIPPSNSNFNPKPAEIKFIKSRPEAIIPSKSYSTDTGYDLSIIDKVTTYNSKTTLYTTGIKIQISDGYYTEIVPRSSFSKSGHIQSNGIGIIDCSYQGELMVAVTKIVDDAPDLVLPYRGFQLLVRPLIHSYLTEVFSFEKSDRGEGGFGSTGK